MAHTDKAWVDYAPGQSEIEQLERDRAEREARIAARPANTRAALIAACEQVTDWHPTAREHQDYRGGMWRQCASIEEARSLVARLRTAHPLARVSNGQWTPGFPAAPCRIVWFACDRAQLNA